MVTVNRLLHTPVKGLALAECTSLELGLEGAPFDRRFFVVNDAGDEIDLTRWPIQTCWPGDAGPLLTWGLVITRGPRRAPQPLHVLLHVEISGHAAMLNPVSGIHPTRCPWQCP